MSLFGPLVDGREVSVRELASGFDARNADARRAAKQAEALRQRTHSLAARDQNHMDTNSEIIAKLTEELSKYQKASEDATTRWGLKEKTHLAELQFKTQVDHIRPWISSA